MLGWILMGVLLGTGGLAALAVLTIRLWRQVRRLAHEVSAAGERIAEASRGLSALDPPRR